MKTMTFIISLLMLPLLGTTSSSYPASSVSGVWESTCGSLTLIIEGDRRGLRVRNHRYGNWAYYDRARGRSKTYVNGRSKSLQIRNSREILFEDRRNGRARLILRRARTNSRGYNYGRNGYDNNYGRAGYNNNYDRRDYSQSYRSNGLYTYDAKKLRKSIDDRWENREYRVRIRIKDTDSGIRMKRDDRGDYIHYLQDFRNPGIFSDSRGNRIEIINKYEIVWYDARNGRSLYFERD